MPTRSEWCHGDYEKVPGYEFHTLKLKGFDRAQIKFWWELFLPN